MCAANNSTVPGGRSRAWASTRDWLDPRASCEAGRKNCSECFRQRHSTKTIGCTERAIDCVLAGPLLQCMIWEHHR